MQNKITVVRVGKPAIEGIDATGSNAIEWRALAWAKSLHCHLDDLPSKVPIEGKVQILIEYKYCKEAPTEGDPESREKENYQCILDGLNGVLFDEDNQIEFEVTRSYAQPLPRGRMVTHATLSFGGHARPPNINLFGALLLIETLEKNLEVSAKEIFLSPFRHSKNQQELKLLFAFFMREAGHPILGMHALGLPTSLFKIYQRRLDQVDSNRIPEIRKQLEKGCFQDWVGFFPKL